ncbi:hypothetical protein HDU67_001482 [Dinochytrium kinnereticum]|nr:hypothetical protein HDU67_001482 [Dinochytrium kinnereticum]
MTVLSLPIPRPSPAAINKIRRALSIQAKAEPTQLDLKKDGSEVTLVDSTTTFEKMAVKKVTKAAPRTETTRQVCIAIGNTQQKRHRQNKGSNKKSPKTVEVRCEEFKKKGAIPNSSEATLTASESHEIINTTLPSSSQTQPTVILPSPKSTSSRGLNIHAAEFIPGDPMDSLAALISDSHAEVRQTHGSDDFNNIPGPYFEGPVYSSLPPLPAIPEMVEVEGEMWPTGYPRYLCPYGPKEVVMPFIDANQNFCYIPRPFYDAYIFSLMAA